MTPHSFVWASHHTPSTERSPESQGAWPRSGEAWQTLKPEGGGRDGGGWGGGVDAARVSRVHGAPLCCDVIRAAPHPGGLSPENPYPESKHEKNITQVQVEGPSTKHLRVLLEAVRAVTNSGRGRHRPARRDPQRRGH